MRATRVIPLLAVVLLAACGRPDAQAQAGHQLARETAGRISDAARVTTVSDSCRVFTVEEVSQLLGGRVGPPEEVGLMGNCRWTAGDGRYVQAWAVSDPAAWSPRDCRRKEALDGIGQQACVGPAPVDQDYYSAGALLDTGFIAVTAPTRDQAVDLLRRAVERHQER